MQIGAGQFDDLRVRDAGKQIALPLVLPASESAMPRSTMTANASSRSISSGELSSGWSSITVQDARVISPPSGGA